MQASVAVHGPLETPWWGAWTMGLRSSSGGQNGSGPQELSNGPLAVYATTDVQRGDLVDLADAEAYLRQVTRRASTRDALKWIEEGRTMPADVRTRDLLAALAMTTRHDDGEVKEGGRQALRAACRLHLRSEIDPSSELLEIDTVEPPDSYRKALDSLAQTTASGTLRDTNDTAVHTAQQRNPQVIPTLCAVAGITYGELRDRAKEQNAIRLPGSPDSVWSVKQVSAAFRVIDQVVRGTVTPRNPEAVAMRPVEMLFADDYAPGGWELVEHMRSASVPYEMLLAQRVVGSSWGAHRNSTSNKVQELVTDKLCRLLTDKGISFRRLKRDNAAKEELAKLVAGGVGQDVNPADVSDVSNQITVLVEPAGQVHAIAVSVATNGGTANKSGSKLKQLPTKFRVPVCAVLVGPGWATRTESAGLVLAFEGRTYTEQTLNQLVSDMSPDAAE